MNTLTDFSWHELNLSLIAKKPLNKSHPLVVFEAIFKRILHLANLEESNIKLLWYSPDQSVESLKWQAGDEIAITLQMFGANDKQLAHYFKHLNEQLTNNPQQNFELKCIEEWQHSKLLKIPNKTDKIVLEFLTPLPLPRRSSTAKRLANTELLADDFLTLCQKRLKKLFDVEIALPSAPSFNTESWAYWQIKHQSKSQTGHTMYINGCIGELHLSGSLLNAWLPWLALFQQIGLGSQLSFSRGRFKIREAEANTALESTPETIISKEELVELRLKRPFIVNSIEQGIYLRLEHNTLHAYRNNESIFNIPLFRISHIELYSACSISSSLIQTCTNQNIPLVISIPGSEPVFILNNQAEQAKNKKIAQHHLCHYQLDSQQKVEIASEFIKHKLQGYQKLIKQRYKKGDNQYTNALQEIITTLKEQPSLAALRGKEGWATRIYFEWFRKQVQSFSEFKRRERKGDVTDPLNSLLNYCYVLLYNRINCLMRLHGLDPWLGILHEANGKHPALVSDFMEIWRPSIDKMILRLIGLQIIQQDSFLITESRVTLPTETRLRLIQEFTKLLEETPKSGAPRLVTQISDSLISFANSIEDNKLTQWSFVLHHDIE